MKPKRTADLSLFLTVTVLLLASVASVSFAQKNRIEHPHDSTDHEFLPIAQNPNFILPMDDLEEDSDYDYGTQTALNGLEGEYDRKVDSVLNAVYKSILNRYSVDTEFIRYFVRAEAAWIKYRDAEMLAIMPPVEPPDSRGSMEGMCWSEY
ncbi:MAG: lysozyme inhibitor LprI family protein, partial [Candidatus Kapaibacterium sp.]